MKKILFLALLLLWCRTSYADLEVYSTWTSTFDKVASDSFCSNGQILKKVAGVWACASDDTGASAAAPGTVRVSEDNTFLVSADTINFTKALKAVASGTTTMVSAEIATTTAVGVASFDSTNFSVRDDGGVSVKNDGIALGTKTTGNYAAGDAEAGNATGVACTNCVSRDDIATQAVSTDELEASNKPTDGQVFSYKQNSLKGKWIGPISKSIGITIDGGGSAITTGVKGYIEVPYACLITRQTTLLDQSGSIKIDIWKDTYANYPPDNSDTITAGAEPTISTATKSQDQVLAGWNKNIASGDVLGFNVDSASTATRAHLILKCDI